MKRTRSGSSLLKRLPQTNGGGSPPSFGGTSNRSVQDALSELRSSGTGIPETDTLGEMVGDRFTQTIGGDSGPSLMPEWAVGEEDPFADRKGPDEWQRSGPSTISGDFLFANGPDAAWAATPDLTGAAGAADLLARGGSLLPGSFGSDLGGKLSRGGAFSNPMDADLEGAANPLAADSRISAGGVNVPMMQAAAAGGGLYGNEGFDRTQAAFKSVGEQLTKNTTGTSNMAEGLEKVQTAQMFGVEADPADQAAADAAVAFKEVLDIAKAFFTPATTEDGGQGTSGEEGQVSGEEGSGEEQEQEQEQEQGSGEDSGSEDQEQTSGDAGTGSTPKPDEDGGLKSEMTANFEAWTSQLFSRGQFNPTLDRKGSLIQGGSQSSRPGGERQIHSVDMLAPLILTDSAGEQSDIPLPGGATLPWTDVVDTLVNPGPVPGSDDDMR